VTGAGEPGSERRRMTATRCSAVIRRLSLPGSPAPVTLLLLLLLLLLLRR